MPAENTGVMKVVRNILWTRESTEGDPYVYNPLPEGDSIRLIRLEAGEWFQNIFCTFITSSLEQVPQYECLSYVWGDETDRRTVVCDRRRLVLSVTASCESALRRLRYRTKPRLLWVDAICIDQKNIDERSKQVQRMGKIYQKASQVVIDLGLESVDSSYAIDCLQTMKGTTQYEHETHLRASAAIDELYSRPWFSRGWVLQEVFMSQKAVVLYGDTMIPWETFKPLRMGRIPWPREPPPPIRQYPQHPPYVLSIGNQRSHKYNTPAQLLSLLIQSRHCSTTDPRDKIFAIKLMNGWLGVQTETGEMLTIPSTNYSHTVVDVYVSYAKILLETVGLSVLSCAQGPQLVAGLPSWVPDWTVKVERNLFGISSVCMEGFAGSKKKETFKVMAADPTVAVLQARGIIADTIATLSGLLNVIKDEEAALSEWITTATSGNSDGNSPLPHFMSILERRNDGKPMIEQTLQRRLPAKYQYDLTIREVEERMNFSCKGRRLFLTKDGYLGLGPEQTKDGDLACILFGSPVPCVLRKVDDHYVFIGESFVYSMMDGEFLAARLKDDPDVWNEFEIR
jgi:hypothetical protein